MSLLKRGLGSLEATSGTLVSRLGSLDAEVQARLQALEGHRNQLFEWRDAAVGTLDKMGREKELLLDRVNVRAPEWGGRGGRRGGWGWGGGGRLQDSPP